MSYRFTRAVPLVALALLAVPASAQTCLDDDSCEPVLADCAPVQADVAIGSVPLSFVAAPNGRDGFFAFAPDASVTVDYGGTAVLTLDDGNRPTTLSLAPDTSRTLRAAAQSPAGRVVLNGRDPGDARSLVGHQRVDLGAVRSGVSAAFTGQGRVLSLDFRVDSGLRDQSVAVRLAGDGLRVMPADGARVPVIAGERTMSLYVHAFTGDEGRGEPVPVEVSVRDGRITAVPTKATGRAPVQVRFELLHSEHQAAPAAQIGGGDVVAVATTLAPQTGERQPYALRQTDGTWQLATWGEGAAGEARSVTADGTDVIVAVDRDGDVELARLGEDLTLTSRVALGGSGTDRSLAVSAGNDLIYVLASLDNPRIETRAFSSLVTQWPSQSENRRPPYRTYLLALRRDVAEPVLAQPIDVPVDIDPTLWINCDGIPVIGVDILQPLMTCDTQAFSIPARANDYTNGFVETTGEWGHMLMQWKQFHASWQAAGSPATPPPPGDPAWTTVPFVPANATPPAGSVLAPGLGAGHASTLNGIEADNTVFTAGNPPGGWNFGNADDLAELGIAVGLYADCCNSPVALAPNYLGARQPMVALGVQYCIHGGVFSQINDLIMDWDDGLTWHPDNNPMDYVDQLWATTYGNSLLSNDYFEVTELYVSHWDGGAYQQNQTVAAPEINALFTPLTPGQTVATDYIADPPMEPMSYGDAIAQELTERMKAKGARKLPVQTTTWRDGKVVDQSTQTASVPARRLAGAAGAARATSTSRGH